MQRLEFLLLRSFHRDGVDPAAAHGLEERFSVGPIGFVSTHVGPNVLRGQQRHAVTMRSGDAGPVVGGAAGLHHQVRRGLAREEPLELWPRQSTPADDPPSRVRQGELEDTLSQVNTDRRSIHVGLLLVQLMGVSWRGRLSAAEPGGVHTITAPNGRALRKPCGNSGGRGVASGRRENDEIP
jgi:hypothetical protein